MIRLTLADGTRIHVNPATISYLQPLPEAGDDKEQAKTKVVLVSGESLSVREAQGRVLVVAGFVPSGPKKKKEPETGGSDE